MLILVGVVALATAGLLLWVVGDAAIAAGFSAMVMASAALILFVRRVYPPVVAARLDYDWSLVRDAADNDDAAIAITDRAGRLVCANALHEGWFGGPVAPPALASAMRRRGRARFSRQNRLARRRGRSARCAPRCYDV